MVIKGLDQGIAQLKKGSKAVITCPPEFAYGQEGLGEVVPPGATLVFEVEVEDWKLD